MRSADLATDGFGGWSRFNLQEERNLSRTLPASYGVYAIRNRNDYQRLRGQSDIYYIGCATNAKGLRNRINQMFHPGPTQSTNKRILKELNKTSTLEISYFETSTAMARMLEAALLERYESDHGELPPGNRRR
jgi:excinuclease UvrABC nuclease subunit